MWGHAWRLLNLCNRMKLSARLEKQDRETAAFQSCDALRAALMLASEQAVQSERGGLGSWIYASQQEVQQLAYRADLAAEGQRF